MPGSLDRVPWWLPGGNVQTIWSATLARCDAGAGVRWKRTRWTTPDGDFVDVDQREDDEEAIPDQAPMLVLFHGLEGSSSSHYARAFAAEARRQGWHMAVPHFRGCSGEINRAPRAYHSGDYLEVGWMLGEFQRRYPSRPLWAVGVSLGGNALLRWAQEAGATAGRVVQAVAAVSSPLDLAAAGHAIDRGFNRQVYARMFLRTMRQKARAKWSQFPGLFDWAAVERAQTLYAFDDAFTSRLHGFRGADDYWARASSRWRLQDLRVPTLVLNASNDPFVPQASLPPADARPHSWVTVWRPSQGGHVGFPSADGAGWRGHVFNMPREVLRWMTNREGSRDG